ncbi:C45 family autoproteolytic acyltransferase/hydolase [Ulvibacter litoralis]|uniref:Acyl-coenzyme A:6-aminopenicillanic acid acyl-transferase n=1 Tax=Ulvibacter litoralis TaxID=227084 RepID=A0A1G7DUT9_9FLAO|nr:C45 family peptidase [Ulvibacter litoralis]GHC42329.1 acyl-CoA--6-aminopenicillanic acid acyl-transferase [Ulvibacter litoralis]SDE54896.1 Acyl-coenzyme A:6-aminopenicillanic acid acyl-transferase [Ulvibacter litoralis]
MRNKYYFLYFLGGLCTLFVLTSCGISKSLKDRPDVGNYHVNLPERTQISDSTFVLGANFLTKNKHGLWELYVEGNPLERGMAIGSLTQELLQKQEKVFLSKVNDLVPSKTKQALLRSFLKYYNRKMYKHVTEEYKTEIYGVSQYSSDTFNSIAPPYLRALYLHSAHDIGHALQDLALVGCSSFAVWDAKTEDGELLIGRNFDFYAGDAFAEEKIVAFVNPSEGYKFMSVTWGGMIGVVSGMNDQGLTVTINAGKSKIPLTAKTPISLVTREILQYASTIAEAIEIAKKREVFVSEAIFIGSANDKEAALIEVSPHKLGVYDVPNEHQLVCSNHFQSDAFSEDKRNIKQIAESHSQYRYDRMEELLSEENKLNPTKAVAILRNKEGLNDKPIGYGNEKALNQLLAHHGIVFQPEKLRVWVSTNPYQLGEFVAYDLNEVFKNRDGTPSEESVASKNLTIAEDPFATSEAFQKYEAYRVLEREVEAAIEEKTVLKAKKLSELQNYNPEYWKAYYLAGYYYYEHKQFSEAAKAFEKAKEKEITTVPDRERVEKYLKKSIRKATQ